ncbi:MAG: macro domain-containing protein [Dysgonomonas sp.]
MTGQERISNICRNIPALKELFNSRVRHYIIKEHTLNVYNQFEKYFSNDFIKIDIELFRLVLLLHDIGKPIASKSRNRSDQHSDTLSVISKHRQALGISDEDFPLFEAVLGDDSLGLYMQNKITLDVAYERILNQSKISKLELSSFFYLLSVYYQCDVASYTVDAGGLKYLEYLFEYSNGNKIYSEKSKLLQFSRNYQYKYDLLLDKINGIENPPKEDLTNNLSTNIKFIKGNIFNTKAQVIVNTVNCVGVMGKGVALVFKLRYPKMFDIYQDYCEQKYIGIGKLWLYKGENDTPWVLNFPTKFHWKYPSKMEYIEKGLSKFVETYKEKEIASIAFPLLGTHNGGLDKQEVLSIMNKHLGKCNIPIEIYEYDPFSSDDLFEKFKEKWNTISMEDKKISTGIRTQKQIETINVAVNSKGVKSMITLIEYNGIGLKTMEKCFNLVMNSTPNATLF